MRRILFALPLLLISCATLSEDQCRAGDWRAIGQRDGAAGRTSAFIEQHAKACAQFGISPNLTLWERGRQDGLPLYCTPLNAWQEGADGARLSPVCPSADQPLLDRLNRRGLIYHRIDLDIREASRDISQIDRELSDLDDDAAERASLIADRASLRLEIISLRTEQLHYRY